MGKEKSPTTDNNSFPAALPLANFSRRYRSRGKLFPSLKIDTFFYNKMGRLRLLNSVFFVKQYAAEGGRAPTILPES
jgi:hypothetical protein